MHTIYIFISKRKVKLYKNISYTAKEIWVLNPLSLKTMISSIANRYAKCVIVTCFESFMKTDCHLGMQCQKKTYFMTHDLEEF